MNIVSESTGIVNCALEYARLGYPVFPVQGLIAGHCSCGSKCEKPGKHPACAHGFKDATLDEGIIRAWWNASPWLNIALATGGSYWVLDVDAGGIGTLAAWEAEHGKLPATAKVKSGGGGLHYYFQVTPGISVRSRQAIGEGIDVRGESGYIIAPPSNHASGSKYEWLVPLPALAQAPDWLLSKVSQVSSAGPSQSTSTSTLVMGSAIQDFATHPGACLGKRNDALCHLVGIHLSRGDSLASIEALALAWADRCMPPCEHASIIKRVHALALADAQKKQLNNSFPSESPSTIANSLPPWIVQQQPEANFEGV